MIDTALHILMILPFAALWVRADIRARRLTAVNARLDSELISARLKLRAGGLARAAKRREEEARRRAATTEQLRQGIDRPGMMQGGR